MVTKNVSTRKTAKNTNVRNKATKPVEKTGDAKAKKEVTLKTTSKRAAPKAVSKSSVHLSKAVELLTPKAKATKKPTPVATKPIASTKPKAVKKVRDESVESWYDHPELYELGFLKETPKESKFLEAVFKKYVPFPVKNVLELGCGSGRLVCDMATRGFSMTGLDLNPTALEYCQKKLKKLGVKGETVVGDMTKFKFDQPFDAAVNAINTFRHLDSEEAALAHLDCVAEHLKPGGVFVLSLHLLPVDGDLWGTERWSAKDAKQSVYYALTVVETSMKTRLEKLRISMLVKKKDKTVRMSDHITLRIYTAPQLKSLLAKAKKLKLVAVHDFWYDIKTTQKLNAEAVDTILVLQRV